MKCKCGNPKEYNPAYGFLDCRSCRDKEVVALSRPFDFVPDRIKEERKEFQNDMIAPFRNGQVSKEFLDLYGRDKIDVTDEEVKNAKNVWGELTYYKND